MRAELGGISASVDPSFFQTTKVTDGSDDGTAGEGTGDEASSLGKTTTTDTVRTRLVSMPRLYSVH